MARSEYGDDWEKAGKPKDPNAPKRGDYVDSTAKSFVKNVGLSTAQGAFSGKKFGAPGMLAGGAIGFARGLFGMEAEIAAQEANFSNAWSSWRKGEKDKLAKTQFDREQSALAKRSKSKKSSNLTGMDSVAQGIMSADPIAEFSEPGTMYGDWHKRYSGEA